jgi:hypothetical protein
MTATAALTGRAIKKTGRMTQKPWTGKANRRGTPFPIMTDAPEQHMATRMSAVLPFIVPVAVGAVAVVLLFGLANMLRGGNANTSQLLMRWRVGLQFLALILIMVAIWYKQSPIR